MKPGDWANELISRLERDSNFNRKSVKQTIEEVLQGDEPGWWREAVVTALEGALPEFDNYQE